MIYGVSINDLPAAAMSSLEATLARLDPRTMPRAKGARPIGSLAADARQADRRRQKRPAQSRTAKSSASMLIGLALTFNQRSAHPVTLNDHLRGRFGTQCRSAHVTYKPGAFDRNITKVERGEEVVRLQLDHDRDLYLCSTSSGALTLRATNEALMFCVHAKTREGRRAIRCARTLAKACREVSVSAYPLKFEWIEPRLPDLPGDLIVRKGFLTEISLLQYGAHGGTYARVI
jgi:hypothetical protein